MKLYWAIDWLIDSYIDWSLTEPSWDGRRLTSGLIQYDPIQYSLWGCCFGFFHVQIFVAQRGQKNNRNTHESITAVIQWLSVNSKRVCVSHCLWGTGLTGFNRGFWGATLPSTDGSGCCRLPTDYIIMLRALMCFSKMLWLRQREAGMERVGFYTEKYRRKIKKMCRGYLNIPVLTITMIFKNKILLC